MIDKEKVKAYIKSDQLIKELQREQRELESFVRVQINRERVKAVFVDGYAIMIDGGKVRYQKYEHFFMAFEFVKWQDGNIKAYAEIQADYYDRWRNGVRRSGGEVLRGTDEEQRYIKQLIEQGYME